jgi:hypothetical protein
MRHEERDRERDAGSARMTPDNSRGGSSWGAGEAGDMAAHVYGWVCEVSWRHGMIVFGMMTWRYGSMTVHVA